MTMVSLLCMNDKHTYYLQYINKPKLMDTNECMLTKQFEIKFSVQ